MNTALQNRAPAPPVPASPVDRGMLLMLVSVGLFSICSLLVKYSGDLGASAYQITTARFMAGFALVFFAFRGQGKLSFVELFTNPWVIFRGILGGVGTYYHNLIIIELGAARSMIIGSTYPIFACLIAPMLLPERLRTSSLVYAGVALLGIALVMDLSNLAGPVNGYDLLALLIALMSGLIVVVIRKLQSSVNTATIFAAQCFYGFLFCFPFAVGQPIPMGSGVLGVVACLSILVALAQLCMTHAYKTVPISKGSILHMMVPILTVAGAIYFLGENLGANDLIGGAITLFACYRIARQK